MGNSQNQPRVAMTSLRKGVGLSAALLAFCVFAALGTWQVERRTWKLHLIDRATSRAHAPVTAAPPRARWAQMSAVTDEYRHVVVHGVFRNSAETLVLASTELGAGFWVLTPLLLDDGSIVLINRGFVPTEMRAPKTHPASDEPCSVTGLVRMTEPRGMLLRDNDPAADRWYSRDVASIARARHLDPVAPYFIDADAEPSESQFGPHPDAVTTAPVGGLTVIAFRNSHLVYAMTWYALALMIPGALWIARRSRT